MKTISVMVDVEVELSDIETSDLVEELERRGQEPEDPEALVNVLRESLVHDWLRKSNPPQAVRDAYYQVYGRILL